MMATSLGNRMKEYEKAFNVVLPKRMPMIIRVDGKCFHSMLRKAKKPFDDDFKKAMDKTAVALVEEIQGAVLAFVQSDEISILVINYPSLDYDPWFGNELQKIVSISSSIATRTFNWYFDVSDALFDSRVFILPKEEVCNYFLWRQQDWTRNSVQMVARSLYSHKDCQNKNNSKLQEMIFKKGINWDKLPIWQKRGRCVYKVVSIDDIQIKFTGGTFDEAHRKIKVDNRIPIFSHVRSFIEQFVLVNENGN